MEGKIIIARNPSSSSGLEALASDPKSAEVPDLWARGDETLSQYVERLAGISSRAAAIGAWREVELVIREALDLRGVPQPIRRSTLAPALAKEGIFRGYSYSITWLENLRHLRDLAVGSGRFSLPAENAAKYGRAAQRFVESLKI